MNQQTYLNSLGKSGAGTSRWLEEEITEKMRKSIGEEPNEGDEKEQEKVKSDSP